MSTENESTTETRTPSVGPGNYSPVTVTVSDSLGAVFLGIFAGIFLIGWMRTEKRYRTLLTQRETTHGNHTPDAG